MSSEIPYWVYLFYLVGIYGIIQGLYWKKTGKARSPLSQFFRVVEKEKEPETYYGLIGLSIGVGILIIILLSLGILFL